MTDQNTDALRCARGLERSAAAIKRLDDMLGYQQDKGGRVARYTATAAHIRRLVVENEAHLAAMRQALEALKTLRHVDWRQITAWDYEQFDAAISTLKERVGDE